MTKKPGHQLLVGKVDIRKLESYAQDDPIAYRYSGVCAWPTGMLELWKCSRHLSRCCTPVDCYTRGQLQGTEGFGAIPFDGIVVGTSNESEWKTFRNNKNNEAFLDRIYIVKVPYCLSVREEVRIYEKRCATRLWVRPSVPWPFQDDGAVPILTPSREPRTPACTARCRSTMVKA